MDHETAEEIKSHFNVIAGSMVLAWCQCGWPDDAHEMETLAFARTG